MRIRNGGIELGVLEFIEKEKPGTLSKEDRDRIEYLKSLPKGVDVFLDKDGKQITQEEYIESMTRGIKLIN